MIDFCMAAKEYEKYGALSNAMILVCIFHFVYVADCLSYDVGLGRKDSALPLEKKKADQRPVSRTSRNFSGDINPFASLIRRRFKL